MERLRHSQLNQAAMLARGGLEDLMALPGVVAAGEFAEDGRLVAYESTGNMSLEFAALCARLCTPVNIMFETLVAELMRFSRMNWLPERAWTFSGGEWTVAVAGNRGVFVETSRADFNDLIGALAHRQDVAGNAL